MHDTYIWAMVRKQTVVKKYESRAGGHFYISNNHLDKYLSPIQSLS